MSVKSYLIKHLPQVTAAALVVGLLVALGWQTNRLHAAQNQAVKTAQAFQQYKLDQQAENQREQQRRLEAMEEIKNEAQQRIAQIQVDADHANASADSMRRQLARLRAASNAAAANGCPPTTDTIGVLTDVLARADARAQRLARIADERGAAGLTCERAYEALSP